MRILQKIYEMRILQKIYDMRILQKIYDMRILHNMYILLIIEVREISELPKKKIQQCVQHLVKIKNVHPNRTVNLKYCSR